MIGHVILIDGKKMQKDYMADSEYAEEMNRTLLSIELSLFFPEAANSPCSLMVNKIGQAGCGLRANLKGQRVSLCCCS